jgi:hypothetical protein
VRNLSTRVPVHWRRPRRDQLERGGIYPSGEPPFDPFPTVTDVMSANFCPVSILHMLLHGIDRSPLLIVRRGMGGAGDLYHNFIAFLKSSIVTGRLRTLNPGIIRREFFQFGRNEGLDTLNRIWSSYLEPWSLNRLNELSTTSLNERVFFEVTVASEYVPFRREGQILTYPLRGVIDEVNLDRRLIIERTIMGGPDDQSPPEPEARQLWLLWKILTSIERRNYPRELSEVNFDEFRLMVETPFNNFEVGKQNLRFEEEIHDAYSWIRDLTFSPRSVSDAYRNQRCEREPGVECGFMYNVCRRRILPYPTARPRLVQELRQWYRPLLWELIWNSHLFQYKLLRLPIDTLEQEGLAVRAQVTSFTDQNTVEIEITREGETGPVLAHIEDAGTCELIFGTPSIGQRVEVRLHMSRGNRLLVQTRKWYILLSNNSLILPNVTLVESRPWFLINQTQRDLFRFAHIGRENATTAGEDSFVQLIESLFGGRVLRRERSDGNPLY